MFTQNNIKKLQQQIDNHNKSACIWKAARKLQVTSRTCRCECEMRVNYAKTVN